MRYVVSRLEKKCGGRRIIVIYIYIYTHTHTHTPYSIINRLGFLFFLIPLIQNVGSFVFFFPIYHRIYLLLVRSFILLSFLQVHQRKASYQVTW